MDKKRVASEESAGKMKNRFDPGKSPTALLHFF